MRQAPDVVAFPWRSPDGRWFHGLGKFETLEFVPLQLQYFRSGRQQSRSWRFRPIAREAERYKKRRLPPAHSLVADHRSHRR